MKEPPHLIAQPGGQVLLERVVAGAAKHLVDVLHEGCHGVAVADLPRGVGDAPPAVVVVDDGELRLGAPDLEAAAPRLVREVMVARGEPVPLTAERVTGQRGEDDPLQYGLLPGRGEGGTGEGVGPVLTTVILDEAGLPLPVDSFDTPVDHC